MNPQNTPSPVATGLVVPPPVSHAPEPGRLRSQSEVMLGLLITFGGLLGYVLQSPSHPAILVVVVPWLGVGFVALWTGGILSGNAQRPLPPGLAPALRAQFTLGLVGTLAGSLSAAVVVRRLGLWTAPAAGAPPEVVVAVVAAAGVWTGGVLMGLSMRRFVRRRRRRAPVAAS